MGGDTEIIEKETGEIKTSKIEVKDIRGEKANVSQEGEFKKKLENDKIEEKLTQFENFIGKYTKQKVTDGIEINIIHGPVGSGEVREGVLLVNLPGSDEISAVASDERSNQLVDILAKAGITYKDFALTMASSTTLHESEHMIIDSRPGSELEKDFEKNTGIKNDAEGHILSFLDEGITYAFHTEKDSENQIINKVEEIAIQDGIKPRDEERFTEKSRKRLGEALRGKVKTYVDEVRQIDEEFLKFAGEEMKKLDIDNYVVQAKREREGRISLMKPN